MALSVTIHFERTLGYLLMGCWVNKFSTNLHTLTKRSVSALSTLQLSSASTLYHHQMWSWSLQCVSLWSNSNNSLRCFCAASNYMTLGGNFHRVGTTQPSGDLCWCVWYVEGKHCVFCRWALTKRDLPTSDDKKASRFGVRAVSYDLKDPQNLVVPAFPFLARSTNASLYTRLSRFASHTL